MKPPSAKSCPVCGERYEGDVLFCPKDGTPLTSPRTASLSGTEDPYVGLELAGQIRIRHLIGIGSMGRVYRAFQAGIERDVAVKILHRELSGNAELVARFHREAKVASRLVHPNVVQVLMTGTVPLRADPRVGGELYLVMEHLDGISLLSALAAAGNTGDTAALPLPRALHAVLQLCDAVGEAHAQGIVHRDIKPENVMLIRRGEDPDFVKVLDFGIARIDWANQSMATQAGLIFGTAKYISPEGAAGESVGPPADVYSIATILYQCLAGRAPFEDESPVALLVQHTHNTPPELRSIPRAAYVPAPIAEIIMTNLAKKPGARAQDARAFGRELVAAMRASGLDPEEIIAHSTLLVRGAVRLASHARTKNMDMTPELASAIAQASKAPPPAPPPPPATSPPRPAAASPAMPPPLPQREPLLVGVRPTDTMVVDASELIDLMPPPLPEPPPAPSEVPEPAASAQPPPTSAQPVPAPAEVAVAPAQSPPVAVQPAPAPAETAVASAQSPLTPAQPAIAPTEAAVASAQSPLTPPPSSSATAEAAEAAVAPAQSAIATAETAIASARSPVTPAQPSIATAEPAAVSAQPAAVPSQPVPISISAADPSSRSVEVMNEGAPAAVAAVVASDERQSVPQDLRPPSSHDLQAPAPRESSSGLMDGRDSLPSIGEVPPALRTLFDAPAPEAVSVVPPLAAEAGLAPVAPSRPGGTLVGSSPFDDDGAEIGAAAPDAGRTSAASLPAQEPRAPIASPSDAQRSAPRASLDWNDDATIQGATTEPAPPDRRRSRWSRVVGILALGVVAAVSAVAFAQYLSQASSSSEQAGSVDELVEQARECARMRAWDSPPGANVKEITGRALAQSPNEPRILDVRRDSAEKIVTEALGRKYAGRPEDALRLAKLALEMNPELTTAQHLVGELEEEAAAAAPAASASASDTATEPPPPDVRTAEPPVASVSTATPKPTAKPSLPPGTSLPGPKSTGSSVAPGKTAKPNPTTTPNGTGAAVLPQPTSTGPWL